MCKSYHSTGFCPYGTRCHFIHNAEDIEKDSSEEDSLDVKPFEGLKIRYVQAELWEFRDFLLRPTSLPRPNIYSCGKTISPKNLILSHTHTFERHPRNPLNYLSATHSIHPTGHRNPFQETQIQIPIQNLTLQNSKQNLTVT